MHIRKLFAAAAMAVALSTALAVPVALTGCAAFGVQAPSNFDERVVAGYKSVETAADLVAAAHAAGKISQAEANSALDRAQDASNAIGVAVDIRNAGDFSNAETRLAAAIAALEILQKELKP